MDEDLESLAQRYALKRNITLRDPLGSGIHGNVLAAQDKTKPGFFAVKFHLEQHPFETECCVYQRLREKQTTRILGFNVPQLLRIDEEFRAIEMTIVRPPFLLDFADARLDETLTSAKMFFDSGRKTKRKFSAKNGRRLLPFSQRCRRSASICLILIRAIFPFPKRLSETHSILFFGPRFYAFLEQV